MSSAATQPRHTIGVPGAGQFKLVDNDEAEATLAAWSGRFLGSIPVVEGQLCPGSSVAAQFFYQDGDRMREFSYDRKTSTSHGVWRCHRCGGDVPVSKTRGGGMWKLGNHLAASSRPAQRA